MKLKITFSLLLLLGLFSMGSLRAQDGVLKPVADPTMAGHGHDHDHDHDAEEAVKAGGGTFKFEEETHNFGELIQGADASFTFKFTNVGTEPITITLAKGSCGCTVPTWPKDPIPVGGTGEIAVRYDSNRVGPIDKFVTILSNANETEKRIFIKGNISAKPAEPNFMAQPTGPASGN